MLSAKDVRGRVETDLTDPALEALIEAENAEIEKRFGPAATPITITLKGRIRTLDILRPIDPGQPLKVTEYLVAEAADVEFASTVDEWWPDVGEVKKELDSTDYRVWNGGRTLERLYAGAATFPRVYWGSRVEVAYTPVDETPQRDEVCMKLVLLSLVYDGLIETTVGEVRVTKGARSSGGGSPLPYVDERERLLRTLQPRKGLLLR